MSERNTVVLTTSAKPDPASSRMARRLAKTRSAWATTSPPTICPVFGSRAICPAVKMNPLATIAWEYGPIAAGARSVWMVLMLTSSPRSWSVAARVPPRILRGVHEVEQPPRVGGNGERKRRRVDAAGGGEAGYGVRDPRGLVALPAIGDRREIGGVGLGENAIVRHEAQQLVVRPLPEGDDAAERDVPSGIECHSGEFVAPRVAVEHSADPLQAGFAHHRHRVGLRLARVDDDGDAVRAREGELRGECGALAIARRVIVVIVEPTLADRDCTEGELGADRGVVVPRVEGGRVVRMNPGGVPDEAGMPGGDGAGTGRGGDRLADADDSRGA